MILERFLNKISFRPRPQPAPEAFTDTVSLWFEGVDQEFQFQLHDNPFVRRWTKALKKAIEKKAPIDNGGVFYGPSIYSKQELVDKMNACVQTINTRSAEKIKLVATIQLDQNFLNELHKEFERISNKQMYRKDNKDQTVFQALVDLNTAIHQCEVYTRDIGHRPSNHFSFDVNFGIRDRYNIEPQDFQYFTPNRSYGEIYLNYATIGVPVLNAFWNKDVTLPVPQRQYTADFRVSFSKDVTFKDWEPLREWVAKTYHWNPDDPRLAIGYISLGRIKNMTLTQQELFDRVQPKKKVLRVQIS